MSVRERIKKWWINFKAPRIDPTLDRLLRGTVVPFQNNLLDTCTQTDTRDALTIKRVDAEFRKQQRKMKMMSMKAHAADCEIIGCNRNPCFIRIPDQIVNTAIVVRDTNYGRKLKDENGSM